MVAQKNSQINKQILNDVGMNSDEEANSPSKNSLKMPDEFYDNQIFAKSTKKNLESQLNANASKNIQGGTQLNLGSD